MSDGFQPGAPSDLPTERDDFRHERKLVRQLRARRRPWVLSIVVEVGLVSTCVAGLLTIAASGRSTLHAFDLFGLQETAPTATNDQARAQQTVSVDSVPAVPAAP